jgi:SAM-dependent methyltransferase
MTSPEPMDAQTATTRHKQTWSAGDFHEIARHNVTMAEVLCAAVDPHGDERVLDVACGSGTAALVAARRYCRVTGIDFVPALIERARARAVAEGLDAQFQVADAQALPFDDATFDVVLSVYGVHFAPDQATAAREMLRVCRPGGRIGLASPMAEGWSGDFFRTHARHAPPPPGAPSPLRWSDPAALGDLLGDGVRAIESEKRIALQYYRSIDHAVDVFATYFGPTIRASQQIDEADQVRLRDDLRSVFVRYNRATDGTAVVENTWLLTVATRA